MVSRDLIKRGISNVFFIFRYDGQNGCPLDALLIVLCAALGLRSCKELQTKPEKNDAINAILGRNGHHALLHILSHM